MRSALALLCLTVACTGFDPPPGTHRVDSDAALSAILEIYTGSRPPSIALPPVYVVPANCTGPEGSPGFWEDGSCRGGLTFIGGGPIYIVADGFNRFSTHLAHEAMHALGVTHEGQPTWPDDSEPGMKIAMARLYLWAHAELDQIADGPRATPAQSEAPESSLCRSGAACDAN